MNIPHKHVSHSKNIVLAVGGFIALTTAGLAVPQLTHALAFPTASNTSSSNGTSGLLNILTGGSTSNTNANSNTTTTAAQSPTANTTTTTTATTPTTATVTTPVVTTTATVTAPTTTTTAPTATVSSSTPASTATTTSPAKATYSRVSYTATNAATATPVAQIIAPIDTASQVALTARAQSIGQSTKIEYHSSKMDPETAKMIYRTAAASVVVAFILLASSGTIAPFAFMRRQSAFTN